ncbi:hypothetical protein BH24ACI5_BH24ACI5_23440 [soil metagenome]
MPRPVVLPLILVVALAAPIVAQDLAPSPADRHKEGHSKLGAAFDEGPRERPAKMAGIGRTHFQITTSKKLRLLSDPQSVSARRFTSYDDFEEMPIHSTILIDKAGRVHWARHGGGPFTDYDFIASQLQRMNTLSPQAVRATAGR